MIDFRFSFFTMKCLKDVDIIVKLINIDFCVNRDIIV